MAGNPGICVGLRAPLLTLSLRLATSAGPVLKQRQNALAGHRRVDDKHVTHTDQEVHDDIWQST